MSIQDETTLLLAANDKYSSSFTAAKSNLPLPPSRRLAVVACMDARLDVAKAIGLEEGDAHVIRNAGGRISDALRSLIISQTLLGTKEVIIIHHTDCGMLTFTDADIRQQLRNKGLNSDHIAFLPFNDLKQSIIDDIDIYHQSALVRQDIPVRGFIYDVKTGKLEEVQHQHHQHQHKITNGFSKE